jgi:RNA polymerase sigma-70 factor, ECF subfamily
MRRADDPDRDALDLVDRGDVTSALHRLMQRYGAVVHRYCRDALRDATLADDVHQQVFLEVFRDLPRFAGRAPVRIWLFAIVRHRVLDAAKARHRAHALLEPTETADAADPRPSPAEWIDETRLHQALAASLDELAEPARAAVLLRFHRGFTFQQMAELCRERSGTLHARVRRALPLLRARIESRIGAVHCAAARRE